MLQLRRHPVATPSLACISAHVACHLLDSNTKFCVWFLVPQKDKRLRREKAAKDAEKAVKAGLEPAPKAEPKVSRLPTLLYHDHISARRCVERKHGELVAPLRKHGCKRLSRAAALAVMLGYSAGSLQLGSGTSMLGVACCCKEPDRDACIMQCRGHHVGQRRCCHVL